MSKVVVLEYGDTYRRKHIPIKLSLICHCCKKEIILEYKNGKWPKSGSAMTKILKAAEDNSDVEIFCSKSCSNSLRDHSYMSKINSTFDIKCIDCSEYYECSFKDLNNGVQKASKSVKCYTKKNLTDKNLLKWRNSEENKNRWVKAGHDRQKYFWDLYFNNDKDNKDWIKAKNFCTKIIEKAASHPIFNFQKYRRDKITGQITHINDIPIKDYINSIKKLPINMAPDGFKIINTFRTQDSLNRNQLLDEYLANNNIKWFVYIKYDELGIPLVVGKSGSKLVNKSGCDVIFDKNPDGGPARQYLINNNLNWNKTQIAISESFDDESDALIKEKEISEKYSLFCS